MAPRATLTEKLEDSGFILITSGPAALQKTQRRNSRRNVRVPATTGCKSAHLQRVSFVVTSMVLAVLMVVIYAMAVLLTPTSGLGTTLAPVVVLSTLAPVTVLIRSSKRTPSYKATTVTQGLVNKEPLVKTTSLPEAAASRRGSWPGGEFSRTSERNSTSTAGSPKGDHSPGTSPLRQAITLDEMSSVKGERSFAQFIFKKSSKLKAMLATAKRRPLRRTVSDQAVNGRESSRMRRPSLTSVSGLTRNIGRVKSEDNLLS